jgi:hypothetical protein
MPKNNGEPSPPQGKAEQAEPRAAPRKRRRWPKRLAVALGAFVLLLALVWTGVHRIPGFGAALVDAARAVLGARAVAWLEDTAYGVEDRLKRWFLHGSEPEQFWEAPSPDTEITPEAGFPPPAFTPPFVEVSTPSDGHWTAVPQGPMVAGRPLLVRSVVHPDPARSFAAVALVAMDWRQLRLHLVAGTVEPKSHVKPAAGRPGKIPHSDWPNLVASFDGGFKTIHGQFGMMLNNDVFLPPRDSSCTVAIYKDGHVEIGPWPTLRSSQADMVGYRQTPPCLVENGELNEALWSRNVAEWGNAVDGTTVIRRSALGVDATGTILLFGLGESMTNVTLAKAMAAAGAVRAAQLDVNYPFVRFLVYTPRPYGQLPRPTPLIAKLVYRNAEYLTEPSTRDFFYITLASADAQAQK